MNDNYWHGIIPFTILTVCVAFWGNEFRIMAELVLCLAFLQFFNEWKQAVHERVIDYYGSWRNFQYNSKDDVKYYVIGTLAGIILGYTIYGIYHG